MFGFEKKVEKVAPINVFVARMLVSLGIALGLIAISLAIGVLGYHFLGYLPWIDAFLEASMILGGEGPVHPELPDQAKIFASFYALYSGLMLIVMMGIFLSPVVHRILHQFHIDSADQDEGPAPDENEGKTKKGRSPT